MKEDSFCSPSLMPKSAKRYRFVRSMEVSISIRLNVCDKYRKITKRSYNSQFVCVSSRKIRFSVKIEDFARLRIIRRLGVFSAFLCLVGFLLTGRKMSGCSWPACLPAHGRLHRRRSWRCLVRSACCLASLGCQARRRWCWCRRRRSRA
jgi:hypothetical protein